MCAADNKIILPQRNFSATDG